MTEKFIFSLKKEISQYALLYGGKKFNSVYFGGGTPSVLSHKDLNEIISFLRDSFDLSRDPEISMEANPEDFRDKNFKDYKAAGINRISFGVQSFIDEELKFLTRQHSASEAEETIRKAADIFANINIDIIYSLPSQTKNDIEISLNKTISLGINHISAYTLTFEERTPLYKLYKSDRVRKNPESSEAEMYHFVSEKLLSNGYRHYEVSNFARNGFECIHNLKYWEYNDYIGFGPSSHSMIDNVRWNNFRDLKRYGEMLSEGLLPVEEKLLLTEDQKKLEYIMLSLRSKGIDFRKYSGLFGKEFKDEFYASMEELTNHGFALNTGSKFSLTEKGYSIADEIIAKYF